MFSAKYEGKKRRKNLIFDKWNISRMPTISQKRHQTSSLSPLQIDFKL